MNRKHQHSVIALSAFVCISYGPNTLNRIQTKTWFKKKNDLANYRTSFVSLYRPHLSLYEPEKEYHSMQKDLETQPTLAGFPMMVSIVNSNAKLHYIVF